MQDAPLIEPRALYPDRAGRPAYTPLDVRAPVEVARGALPFAVHGPILDDEERRRVGVRYKEEGQEAAVRLGYALTEAVMPSRVAAWREVCAAGPTAVTCWRGGLRSRLAAEFIDRPGVVRVAGGYKALRAHLVGGLAPALARKRALVLAGLTGSGKTDLLGAVRGDVADLRAADLRAADLQVLDLEGLANHRGSAFGANGAQPSQQTFENALAAELLLDPAARLLVEDESRSIGRRTLPDPLYARLRAGPVVLLEVPLAERVRAIHRDYVAEPSAERGAERVADELAANLARLRPRLGGEPTDRALEALRGALAADAWLDPRAHAPWIGAVLERYYDPLYLRSLSKLDRPVLFRGSPEEVRAWLTAP